MCIADDFCRTPATGLEELYVKISTRAIREYEYYHEYRRRRGPNIKWSRSVQSVTSVVMSYRVILVVVVWTLLVGIVAGGRRKKLKRITR